ncbi:MAG TPA: sulfatase-like hydrolase/transferase [Chitinophagaceae bacterium]|nr:sulfatase-like hydrolase/transferase [Chitinophagaceae bacterium]
MLLVCSAVHSQRPNIIYIMTDDMGYGDLSGYGRKDYSTPNLDKLASQGVKFTNAYAAAPVCTPTRTAFMTGRYPARTPIGLLEPLTPTKKDSAYGLSAGYPSIATLMKEKGYETVLIGKWHLGFLSVHSPLKNGFDYFFGIHTGAADYISHTGDEHVYDLFENDKPVYVDGYLTELFTQKAIDFIKQKHQKPFFLEVAYNAPHWPWQGPGDKAYPDTASMKSGGSPAIYTAMMKSLDDGVGMIMKTLEEENLAKNTIVIFTNDNGGERYSDNGGFSNAKFTLWEGGIRVPAFVRWPGKIKAGMITKQIAITMDWTATILALAGAKADPNFPLDGIDLMPVMRGKIEFISRILYWRVSQRNQQKAMREFNMKYLQDEKGEYLFNVNTDPQEKNDLKLSMPKIFEFLKNKYAQWEKTVLAPIPLNR